MVTLGGLLASAVVKIAGDKLGSCIAEQASLVWNITKHLEDMKDTLDTIGAKLQDAEKRSIKEKEVRLWLKRLKYAAYDISDMLDDFQTTSAQATEQQMTGVLPVAIRKILQANKMKGMREKLRKIEAQHMSFVFMRSTISTIDEEPNDRRETISMNGLDIVGRDVEKQKLIDLLSASDNNNQTMILPIYGLGGIGKTTLARLVYNDTQFKEYDHRVWVYVSKVFGLRKIGRSIISQLTIGGGQQNIDDLESIYLCLNRLLRGKKILIVLDDIWEEKDLELKKLTDMLDGFSKKGSMIDVLVTTRKEDIAKKVSTSEPYKLQPLRDDMCWDIIKRLSQFEQRPNKQRFEQIGLDIAKKCGGVPLAACALGYMLKSKEDLAEWSKLNNSDIWSESSRDDIWGESSRDDSEEVLPSLKLSYECMPPHLRLCFAYCAIFPKGHDIVHDDLIHQWIALDFIKSSNKRLGEQYVDQFLGMSFLQHSKFPSTSEEHVVRYTMHDLVHDLARSIMDELIVYDVAPKSNTHGQKYCRYALLTKYDRSTKLSNILPSKVRALHFSDSGKLDVPGGAFSFAKCLRILDFSACSSILLPASIGQLKQLKCLVAPRMQNDRLPECVTELSKLQYLNLDGSSQISALPESIGKLGCLLCLRLSGCSGISKLPESFGDLESMVHLDMSGCFGIRELPGSLGNLTNLQHLELSKCSSVKEIPESLCGLTQLQYLNLSSCLYLGRLPEAIGSLINLQYLNMSFCSGIRELPESFKKLRNLLHLNLTNCSGILKLPESFGDLECMVQLDMSGCSGITELPGSLGNLINLQHLYLSGCKGLKAIPESLCGLTQLRYLNMLCCEEIRGLPPEAIGSLVGLQYLDMSQCYYITELPESFKELKNLLHLNLSGCYIEKGLPGALRGLTALQYLAMAFAVSYNCNEDGLPDAIRNLTNLEYLSLSHGSIDRLFEHENEKNDRYLDFIGSLTKLEHLDLSANETLMYLPDCIGNLKRLHKLDLSYCPNLKSLPESVGEIRSLLVNGCSDELIDEANSRMHYSQTLPLFKVRADGVNACSNLHLLEDVNVNELRISALEKVRFLEEARKVKLLDKENLSTLTLAWTSGADRLLLDKDLLGQLVPPIGLKYFTLEGYSSPSFPSWLMDISHHLPNLTHIVLFALPTCSNPPPLGQLPNLEMLRLSRLPSITKIERDFCGGKGAFRRLSYVQIFFMEGLEEWNTTYCGEDGVEEFMFPVLEELSIQHCPRLRLKPCPPTFRECSIWRSDQVISSLEVSNISHLTSSTPRSKLTLGSSDCQSFSLFHHFPALQELSIVGWPNLMRLPESMRHLASLQSLQLGSCESISELPEWLGDLSSLKSLRIRECKSIKSLPPCIEQLTNLEKLDIWRNQELKKWCESEENKMKLAQIYREWEW